jgi:hypothetical protein
MQDPSKRNKTQKTSTRGKPNGSASKSVAKDQKREESGRRREPERNPTFESREQLDAAMPGLMETVESIVWFKASSWELPRPAVEDVVASTCYKALKYWYAVPSGRGQKAWIATAARNVWRDMRKKIRRERDLVDSLKHREIRFVPIIE